MTFPGLLEPQPRPHPAPPGGMSKNTCRLRIWKQYGSMNRVVRQWSRRTGEETIFSSKVHQTHPDYHKSRRFSPFNKLNMYTPSVSYRQQYYSVCFFYNTTYLSERTSKLFCLSERSCFAAKAQAASESGCRKRLA